MKYSLNQQLHTSQLQNLIHNSPKTSQTSSNLKNSNKMQNKQFFENWLNSNFEQKNLKNHEEVPEENLHPLDYRIEIEKRFKNSVVNKIYLFPRKPENELSISSDNSSIESLKHVTLYELSVQNYKEKYIKSNEKVTNFQKEVSKEIPLGLNYKQFLNLLEKTIKNVNISDLKKIKINNFLKKEGNDMPTPHFLTTTHKESALKRDSKFRFLNKNDNSVGRNQKTLENSYNYKKTNSNLKNANISQKFIENNPQNYPTFIKAKKLNINARPAALSFTRNNMSQMNSPSFSINKTVNNTGDDDKNRNLPLFLKNAMKKAKNMQILDKDLIKNLNIYRNNERKPLYQNIQQKLMSNINKENHKKNLSCYNEKNISNSKIKVPLTSKEIVESLENLKLGSQSEEIRHKYKPFHTKKLTELMKSYEIDDNFNIKNMTTKFKSTKNTFSNERIKMDIGKQKNFYKTNTSEEIHDTKESFKL